MVRLPHSNVHDSSCDVPRLQVIHDAVDGDTPDAFPVFLPTATYISLAPARHIRRHRHPQPTEFIMCPTFRFQFPDEFRLVVVLAVTKKDVTDFVRQNVKSICRGRGPRCDDLPRIKGPTA